MAYLLDANVFMTAKKLHYGFDFCPAFWDWLVARHAAGIVFSIDKVRDEILVVDDELAAWARDRDDGFFISPGASTQASLVAVANWATGQGYKVSAINIFLNGADYYLVAQARETGHTVVTHETPGTSPKEIKIPNACLGAGVKWMNPYEMLRRERARFVLEDRP